MKKARTSQRAAKAPKAAAARNGALKRKAQPQTAVSPAPAGFKVELDHFTLPNGLEVYVQEDHSSPTVSLSLTYKVGSRHEVPGRSGFAHLFEHLMFEGSENVPAGAFSKYIEENGGADNAYTSLDHTNYHEILPSNLFELALWLEADRMASLIVGPETLAREQRVVQEEIRLRILNKPYIRALEEDLGALVYSKWENQHSVAGTLRDVGAADLGEVRAFFAAHYAPNNAVLVIVGDVTKAQARRLVAKHLGPVPSKPLPPQPDLAEPEPSGEKRLQVKDPLAKLPQALLVWHMPPRASPDFWPLALVLEYLTGGEESPLYRALVKEKQSAIDSGGYFPMWSSLYDYKEPDLYALTLLYRPEHPLDDVLKDVDALLDRFRREGLPEADLARAKARMKFSWLGHFQFSFDRAKHFSAYAAVAGDPRGLQQDLQALLSVTSRDVRECLERRLLPSRRVVLDIVPGAAPLSEETAAAAPAKPPEPAAAVAGAKPPKGTAPRPARIPSLERFQLSNGLRVAVAEDRTLPLLQVRLALPAGSARTDVPGLAEAAADLVLKGTAGENARQIAEGFSSLGSRLDAQEGPDHMIWSGSLLAESAAPYFQRLASIVTGASFPADEVGLWVKNMREELKLRRFDPGFLAEERLEKRLFAGHPYEHLSPTLESLERIRRPAVAEFFRAHAVPESGQLVLVGGLGAAQARELLEKSLASWKGGKAPADLPEPAPPASPSIQLVHREESKQANIVLKSRIALRRRDPDFHAFQVLNQVLGIGFNSRLNRNLRIKHGYTYGVFSQPELRRRATVLEIATETNGGVVLPALQEILRELEGLRAAAPSAEELRLARRFLIGSFVMRLAHQPRFTGQVLALALEGLDPRAELAAYQGRIEGVSAEAVHAAALKHLDPASFQIAVVGDARQLAPALRTLGLPVELFDTEGRPLSL